VYCNVVEIGAIPHENGIEVETGPRGDNTVQPFLGARVVSVGNSVHHNTVIWDDGATGVFGYLQGDAQNQPDFFQNNTPPDHNDFHLPSTSLALFVYDNDDSGASVRKTFTEFRAAGADVDGTIDTLNTSGFPTVAVTSPADGTKVSGSILVSASASDTTGITKVEFYVDWVLRDTVSKSPYDFSWSGGSAGAHTVAAMAYGGSGVRACNAVTLDR
jgi:hypothetical protein